MTYLGIDLNRRITFKPKIEKATTNESKCIRSPYPLISRKSRLSFKNKDIRPVMTYGCPIWHQAAATHIKKTQVVQNKALNLSTSFLGDSLRYYSIGLPSTQQYVHSWKQQQISSNIDVRNQTMISSGKWLPIKSLVELVLLLGVAIKFSREPLW